MIPVKVDDLAALLGKSRAEVERMLQRDEVIELRLTVWPLLMLRFWRIIDPPPPATVASPVASTVPSP